MASYYKDKRDDEVRCLVLKISVDFSLSASAANMNSISRAALCDEMVPRVRPGVDRLGTARGFESFEVDDKQRVVEHGSVAGD